MAKKITKMKENLLNDFSQLVSVEVLAELLSISSRNIWRRLSKGKFPEPVRITRSTRWSLKDIEQWIEDQKKS